jgi:protein transport protein SEC24
MLFVYLIVPEEFSYDPVSKSYGDPQRRPEIRSSTIEFIAPSEYMVNTLSDISQ